MERIGIFDFRRINKILSRCFLILMLLITILFALVGCSTELRMSEEEAAIAHDALMRLRVHFNSIESTFNLLFKESELETSPTTFWVYVQATEDNIRAIAEIHSEVVSAAEFGTLPLQQFAKMTEDFEQLVIRHGIAMLSASDHGSFSSDVASLLVELVESTFSNMRAILLEMQTLVD